MSECTGNQFSCGRAWIEVSREALKQNVLRLQSLLPENCKLMPAVKANAYGHGAVLVAKELNALAIDHFCVASISEGIELREHGVFSEILILGYTHPQFFPLLRQYDLIQTVVDADYATEMNAFTTPLCVHIAVDTGMHRIGLPFDDEEGIAKIFELKNLKVSGMFSHFCVADSLEENDRNFSELQLRRFDELTRKLKDRGLDCGELHLQSSFGILNYHEFKWDCARPGIALYGVLGTRTDYNNLGIRLEPVLTLKARVTSVREIAAGEGVGYGLTFRAGHTTRLATLSIGYADGLPRALSCGVGHVLLHGKKAPIVGRICMDQTIVDVTDVPNVKSGDVAVLIGCSNGEEISAYDVAEQADTITYEIFTQLGSRVERILV